MNAVIRLRVARDGDRDLLFGWFNDPDAIAMAAFTQPALADGVAFDAHDHRVRSDPQTRHRAIEADDTLVGSIASFPIEEDIEVTYWIDSAAWGRGIATEALRQFVTEVDPRRPLTARVADTNIASVRVLRSVGFREVGQEHSFAAGVGKVVKERIFTLE
jgi:RimJ/RimL family protein N-acetyltransferase